MTETPEHRLKRLHMRSWRRGTKEMDMILGPFADTEISGLSANLLEKYEELLNENDQDLYVWMSKQENPPLELVEMVGIIQGFHKIA